MKSQIIIPVHDRARPILRAVESVLNDSESGVIVVAHNIDPKELGLPQDPRVMVLQVDGYPERPGAAFDAGISAATSDWVGILGSDDWFETGALSALRIHGETDNADGVIVPLAYQGGARGFSPRTLRRRRLQAARDRLFYRTAPLGLYRRRIMQDPDYAFGHMYPVGSDLQVSARLWTSGLSISHYPGSPAYVVGSDAKERTTLTRRPLSVQGKAWLEIWNQPWTAELNTKTRHALAVKILRVHVLGALSQRPNLSEWSEQDSEWLVALTHRILIEDPNAFAPLRRATSRTLRAIAEGNLPTALVSNAAERQAGLIDKVLVDDFSGLLEPDAPLRWNAVAMGNSARQKVLSIIRLRGHRNLKESP